MLVWRLPGSHSLAMDDRRLAATTEQWDADPWLLNTPDGVVNLRTGKLREHRPEDYMTAITAVSPGGKCPLWHKFIARVTNDGQPRGIPAVDVRLCAHWP